MKTQEQECKFRVLTAKMDNPQQAGKCDKQLIQWDCMVNICFISVRPTSVL